MTQHGEGLAQPVRPRRSLTLVPGAGKYAVPHGDIDACGAAPARASEATSAAPRVETDPFSLSWEPAAAVSASVVSVRVTSGSRRCRGVGVIVDTAGHILTRHRVAAAAVQGSTISVTLKDRRTFEAKVVRSDPSTDLAVIELTNAPKDLKAIEIDDAKAFTVGRPTAS
ncbi:MAG: trypsin-like peptidase domain-containing protein [Actinomycetota bacterium]